MKKNELLQIPDWKRAVIKVGSALVAPGGNGCSTQYLLPLASFITECREQGREIILVSSGAVAAGAATQPKMNVKRQWSIPEKQALAAIGQTLLMENWNRFFDFPCAQLLLTYDDIHHRRRFVNIKNTMKQLLKMNTLPVVNENDTVAVHELKVGDNDNLAAYVADVAEADLLIICTDIDGLYEADPRKNETARLIPEVTEITDEIYKLAGGAANPLGTGGMRTKIEAASKAAARGIYTILINGKRRENFEYLLQGQLHGTLFHPRANPRSARKHWMIHALPSAGRIFVDAGAANALQRKGASLLPSGIVRVEGDFTHGAAVDVMTVVDGTSVRLAKGITQYNSTDMNRIMGHQSLEIESILGYVAAAEIIHRDDLALMK